MVWCFAICCLLYNGSNHPLSHLVDDHGPDEYMYYLDNICHDTYVSMKRTMDRCWFWTTDPVSMQ